MNFVLRVLFGAVAGCTLLFATFMPHQAAAVWLDCELDFGMASRASDNSTVIEVFNDTRRDLELYWIDFDGEAQFYDTIRSGEVYGQESYEFHVWMITYLNGDCRNMFRVDEPDEFFRLWE